MDLVRGSPTLRRSLLADGRGQTLDLYVVAGVDLVEHGLLVELLLGGGIVATSLPHLVSGGRGRHRVGALVTKTAFCC